MKVSQGLKLEGIFFRFSSGNAWFFNNLFLNFSMGQLHFIRGSNGIGKSTLFRILQGTIESQEEIKGILKIGDISVNLAEKHCFLNDHIKMVHQKFDTMLADRFNFEQNLRMVNAHKYPGLSFLPKLKVDSNLLNRFSIDKTKPVHLLSGGQRQILAILMALQKPTQILLLDEPTAALDSINAKMVMTFLQELVTDSGLTILIICHDKELVYEYALNGYFELELDATTLSRTISYKNL